MRRGVPHIAAPRRACRARTASASRASQTTRSATPRARCERRRASATRWRESSRARETVTETQRAANDALVAALEAATRRGGAEAFARDRGSETKARGVRAVFDDVGPVPTTPTGRDGRRNE